jgi:hypothetical protein
MMKEDLSQADPSQEDPSQEDPSQEDPFQEGFFDEGAPSRDIEEVIKEENLKQARSEKDGDRLSQDEKIEVLANQVNSDPPSDGPLLRSVYMGIGSFGYLMFGAGLATLLFAQGPQILSGILFTAVGLVAGGIGIWEHFSMVSRISKMGENIDAHMVLLNKQVERFTRQHGSLEEMMEAHLNDVTVPIPVEEVEDTTRLQSAIQTIRNIDGMEAEVQGDRIVIISRQGGDIIEIKDLSTLQKAFRLMQSVLEEHLH